MARDLSKSDNIPLRMLDSVSGTEIMLYYRTPTTEDRVGYQARRFRREGDKLINCARRAAIDAAAGVLTGIREGDFFCDGKPLASDPASANYRPDWHVLIKEMAGDLLFVMGYELFEGRTDLSQLESLEVVDEGIPQEETDGGEIPPLAKSSGE